MRDFFFPYIMKFNNAHLCGGQTFQEGWESMEVDECSKTLCKNSFKKRVLVWLCVQYSHTKGIFLNTE